MARFRQGSALVLSLTLCAAAAPAAQPPAEAGLYDRPVLVVDPGIIPKLRQGSYFPRFPDARKVSEKALIGVIQG